MNEIFLIGEIIENIEFSFVLNSKKTSKATTKISINKKENTQIVGFDNIADFMYSKLKIWDRVFINGSLVNNCIYIKNIYFFQD